MPHYTKRLDKVIKGLQKASKTHARQAEILLKILKTLIMNGEQVEFLQN